MRVTLFDARPGVIIQYSDRCQVVFSYVLCLRPTFSKGSPRPSAFDYGVGGSFVEQGSDVCGAGVVAGYDRSTFLRTVPRWVMDDPCPGVPAAIVVRDTSALALFGKCNACSKFGGPILLVPGWGCQVVPCRVSSLSVQ